MVRNMVKVEVIGQRDHVGKRLNEKRNNSTQVVTVEELLEIERTISSPQNHGVIAKLFTRPFSNLDSSAACNMLVPVRKANHTPHRTIEEKSAFARRLQRSCQNDLSVKHGCISSRVMLADLHHTLYSILKFAPTLNLGSVHGSQGDNKRRASACRTKFS